MHRRHSRVSPTFCDQHQPNATAGPKTESRVTGREGGALLPSDPMSPARYGVPPRPFADQHRPGCVMGGKGFLFGQSLGAGVSPSHNGLPTIVNVDPLDRLTF